MHLLNYLKIRERTVAKFQSDIFKHCWESTEHNMKTKIFRMDNQELGTASGQMFSIVRTIVEIETWAKIADRA